MSDAKIVTLAELRTNNTKDKLWVLIHEKGTYSPPVVQSYAAVLWTDFRFFCQCTMSLSFWTRYAMARHGIRVL
jgi:hypothetical protein